MQASFEQVAEWTWELPATFREDMRVPVRVFADEYVLEQIQQDHSLDQLVNVSTLPGVTRQALGMPDMHEGYGFPVGGVAATVAPDGIISPGGIGFDINCGVRLLASTFRADALADVLEVLVHQLSRTIPTGFGRHGRLALSGEQMDGVLRHGVPYLVHEMKLGLEEDLAHIESGGSLERARPSELSLRARQRGEDQLGTLGGGNHFLEVDVVDEVLASDAAGAMGLFEGQLVVLIHTGSRGLGHQVASDYVKTMLASAPRYGIAPIDRQLACAPLSSPEGQAYFAATCAAANFAWCNRQVLTHRVREAFSRELRGRGDPSLRVVYDVAHNIAKLERYGAETLCVHRKGATRAFGPGDPEIPADYSEVGQPVFIPGSMGTASWVLVGTARAREVSLGSCCHGAGRLLSRTAAKQQVQGHVLRKELEGRGIVVRCPSNAELAEEAPLAYKDVEEVTDIVERVGIARKVARLRPLGVLKG